ncbi:hypothetical protein E5F05_10150 [Deinococcus metallilatus]|uniref:Uncharacterized protein n=1 Tax=Deinococcus metallilatus TaxID=1211322 RepID=A0AAJ5F2A7_9DEIO|nr:hypothetical protein [Deinococcus metallilatus]MBB5295894.1 hypothetical protein [Deinococcus metallilatus]QBY08271.1 hypothetical protein E5F05_10150 [Deinococcus metallilatus]RXJ12002.1 hypothetical protein ERJ73_08960 [Deinococcus metallilatus]TLK25766.1 hypothetical protein FCS05_12020 [Deinococcus metallilatus]GMA14572.1 hypothetical protein GCM10025871_09030 [Deinococcus metallilatus]
MTAPAARLSPEAFARARAFLLERGRPLEAARFRHAFEGGEAEAVLTALRAYRNGDGGFGRTLEPDVRAPESSVLATALALRVLHDLNVPAAEPLLGGAVEWLRSQLRAEESGTVWPFLPPEAEAQPHAPWWNQQEPGQLAQTFGGFQVNPRAEIVARLHRWPELLPEGLLALLTVEVRDAVLAGLEAGDVNGHHVAAVFAQQEDVPEEYREPVLEYLHDVLPGRVARTPEDFAGYGLNALTVAPTPASPLAPTLEEPLAASLAHLLTSQAEDGSWGPNWSWFGQFPEAWPQAEAEWRSVLTLEALLTLRAWGRL